MLYFLFTHASLKAVAFSSCEVLINEIIQMFSRCCSAAAEVPACTSITMSRVESVCLGAGLWSERDRKVDKQKAAEAKD